MIDGEYIWKYTHKAYDFSVLGNTPITFPIEWQNSKIPGYAIRARVPNFHGLTAFRGDIKRRGPIFQPASWRGSAPLRCGSAYSASTTTRRLTRPPMCNINREKQCRGSASTGGYDSGLVAGPAPCAGGNCANGPNGTDTMVDVSDLTPDQQFQAGLYCGSVYATPTTPISPNSVCPASEYGSKYLSIPAAGTENDDHNPPRIASRNLFDAAIGHDNIFHGDKYKWSARLSVVNLTNKEALYNFISTFSGTHYVSPRAITAMIGFHF